MKSQVVLSAGRIAENIFSSALKYIPTQLSSISLTTILYQVQMILVLLGTVNTEGGILA